MTSAITCNCAQEKWIWEMHICMCPSGGCFGSPEHMLVSGGVLLTLKVQSLSNNECPYFNHVHAFRQIWFHIHSLTILVNNVHASGCPGSGAPGGHHASLSYHPIYNASWKHVYTRMLCYNNLSKIHKYIHIYIFMYMYQYIHIHIHMYIQICLET